MNLVHSEEVVHNISMPDTHAPSRDTTFLAKALSGGVAGCFETSITMPFETTKTVQQLENKPASLLQTATSIYHTKGIRGFYYGLPACLVQASGKVAVRFSCYGFYHNLFTTKTTGKHKNSSVLKGLAGVCAGATESCWIRVPEPRTQNADRRDVRLFNLSIICIFEALKLLKL